MELLHGKTQELIWFVFWSGLMIALSIACRIFRRRQIDIIGKMNLFLLLSAALVVLSLWSIFGKGLKHGLDFTGGTLLELAFHEEATSGQIRDVLSGVDPRLATAQIQLVAKTLEQGTYKPGEEPKSFAIVRTDFLSQESVTKIQEALGAKLGKTELLKHESIGPTVGGELKRGATLAIIVALIAQLFYITFRFGVNVRYGIAADIALLHDVIIMVGFYSLTGREVDSPFVAALLTVIGYSVMDSIVIFDRIRENLKTMHKASFPELVNTSVLQTMTRSVNTLLTVLFTLFALYFFGGETLKNFAFALLVGVTSGAYSSIFVASPTLVLWDRWRAGRGEILGRPETKGKIPTNGKRHVEETERDIDVPQEPGTISTPSGIRVSQEEARRAARNVRGRRPRRRR